jgi:hypothetical protein
MTVKNATKFVGIAVPRIPQAPENYDPVIQEMYSNVLRLYFNQLNGVVNQLSASTLTANQANQNNNIQLPYIYTVGKLPSAVSTGAGVRSFVSDATTTTFASIAAGGGSNKIPVYSDGTNWRIG